MAEKHSFYDILGVTPDASTARIRSRFKELARRLHPDRFHGEDGGGGGGDFQAITEAFNVLTDPDRRRDHDFQLAQAPVRQERDSDRIAQVMLQRGQKAFRGGKYAEAAESFRRATVERPDMGRAWYHLALACSKSPRWKTQAVDAITRACELEPMNVEYLTLGGRVLAQAGLAAKAEKFYTEALHWGGEDPAIEQAVAELRRPR